MRDQPNIIITGTPGVGKTTHCEMLAQNIGLNHLSINQISKEQDIRETYDEELKTWIVDEDKVVDAVMDKLEGGGCIVDWHACDMFPERLIDLVVVLRVDSTLLYDRLKAREYPEAKLQENLDCEIMEVLLEEARENYAEEVVVELRSDTTDEVEANIERIEAWIKQWKEDHANKA